MVSSQTPEHKANVAEQGGDTHDSTWIGIFGAWLKQKTFDRIQKQVQDAKKKLTNVHSKFKGGTRNLQELVGQLDQSKQELQELETAMQKVEAKTEIKVVQKKIKQVNALIQRLQTEIQKRGGPQKPEAGELVQKKEKEEIKKSSLMLRELYRDDSALLTPNDPNNILPSDLKGRKAILIEKLRKRDDPYQAFTRKQHSELYGELEKYCEDLNSFRKKSGYGERTQAIQDGENQRAPKKEEVEATTGRLAERLKKEKERYRRSAEIDALNEKIKQGQYLSPKDHTRYLKLLEDHLKDIEQTREKVKPGSEFEHEDEVLSNLAKGKETKIEEIRSAIKALRQEQTKIQNELQTITIVADRQNKIRTFTEKLKEQQALFAQFEEATGFRAQIAERIKEDLSDTDNDPEKLLRGVEELSRARMREFEREKRLEKEGPIRQRVEMARAFARDRIMEEYNDTGRIENLYGMGASHALTYVRTPETFAEDLMKEISERFNIGPEGRLSTESYEWDANGEDKVDLDEQGKLKTDEFAKTAYGEILKEIKAVAERDKKSRDLMSSLEDHAKRTQFEQKVKQDIRLAKLKSELTRLGKTTEEIDTIIQKNGVTEALKKEPPAWNEIKTHWDIPEGQNLDSLDKVEEKLKLLFETTSEQGEKLHNYAILSTPNGLALVFDSKPISGKARENGSPITRDQIFKELITGVADGSQSPDTVAVTLRNNEALKAFATENGAENWDGALMLISSNGPDWQLSHEIQHAIMKELKGKAVGEQERDSEAKVLEDAVEELAIKLATGEIYHDIAFQKANGIEGNESAKRLSLATVAYITPDMIGTGEGKLSNENAQKLHQILEYAKAITEKDLEMAREDGTSDTELWNENTYSAIVADILMSARDANGNIDLDRALKDLQKAFSQEEVLTPNLTNDTDTLLCYGSKDVPEGLETIKHRLNDAGFAYDLGIFDPDYRGDANKIYDYIHQSTKGGGHIGYEREVNELSAVYSGTLGKLPIIGPIGQALLNERVQADEGSTEYELDSMFGQNSLLNLGYKWQNRALGGIMRRFGIGSEKHTKFGSKFPKLFCYLPPFGRGWEQIVKGGLPLVLGVKGAQEFSKKWEKMFPGRVEAEKYMEMNTKLPQTRWMDQIQQIYGVLGKAGLGFSDQEVQRIMGEIPGIKYMFEGGRLVFEPSLLDMDELGTDEEHRGRIKNVEMAEALGKDDIGMIRKDDALNNEIVNIATQMAETYHREDNPITMRDLIRKANIAHDLGINPEIADTLAKYSDRGDVRNKYYLEDNGDAFQQEGDLMVSEHVWYNKKNPQERGIVIDGERYTLQAANELIYRFNSYHVKEALMKGLPEITSEMQRTPHEINFNPDQSQQIPFIQGTATEIGQDPTTGAPIYNKSNPMATYCTIFNTRGEAIGHLAFNQNSNEPNGYVLGTDQEGKPRLYPTIAGKRNRFFASGMMATGVPGIDPDRKDADGNGYRTKQVLELTRYNQDDLWGRYGKAVGFYAKFMQTFKEISRYERRAYFMKTFFGDTKEWTQKLGNIAMVGGLIGAAFTGAPLFAGIFLGATALRIPLVWWLQREAKIYSQRRVVALQYQAELRGKAGMYDELLQNPNSLTRFKESYMHTFFEENNARMEDTAKEPVPKGSAPNDDMAFKMFGGIFGGEGLIARGLSG